MAHLVDIDRIIKDTASLLTLPEICLQLKSLINCPHVSVAKIEDLITKDPALTARLLKLVNSSLYSFPKQIASVSHAVSLIGTQQLYSLSFATSAAALIRSAGGEFIELKTLWTHAVYSAFLAKNIIQKKIGNAENIFTAGILCNIGTLALVEYDPDIAMAVVGYHQKSQFPWQREKEVLGFYIADISEALLASWNVPEDVVFPIKYQNAPDTKSKCPLSCSTIHIATRLAYEMLQETPESATIYRESIDEHALEKLELSPEKLDELVLITHENAPELLSILND